MPRDKPRGDFQVIELDSPEPANLQAASNGTASVDDNVGISSSVSNQAEAADANNQTVFEGEEMAHAAADDMTADDLEEAIQRIQSQNEGLALSRAEMHAVASLSFTDLLFKPWDGFDMQAIQSFDVMGSPDYEPPKSSPERELVVGISDSTVHDFAAADFVARRLQREAAAQGSQPRHD